MIYVRLTCGLGNQMFQYAFGYALAKRKKKKVAFDVAFFEKTASRSWRPFELDQFCVSLTDYRKSAPCLNVLRYLSRRIHIHFGNYYNGYYQSEKYFADFANDIRNEFQFKEKLQAPDGNTVAIHIRRGDYVGAAAHMVCTPFYYEKAAAYICERVENPVFYVFSEDVEWCKENVKIPQPCFYICNTDKQSSYDMQLMSLCKHNIISNSTYSWWAAWLNNNPDKIVIAPDKWLGVIKHQRDAEIAANIYTDNMIKIPAAAH